MRRIARSIALAVLLLTVSECKRRSAEEQAPPSSAGTLASRARPGAAPSVAMTVPAPAPDPLERARAVVNAWDTALNRHDAEALTPLYTSKVTYYAQRVTREKLIESKRKALAATPNYTQALSAVTLTPEADGAVQVSFRKRSGAPNALGDVQARLRLERAGDGYAIALESDAPSDERDDTDRNCLDVAMSVAWSLPEVNKVFDSAPPDARIGGLTYPDEPGRVGGAMGFHRDDHFETVFIVSVENGELSVLEYGTPLKVPTTGLTRVRAKCKKLAR